MSTISFYDETEAMFNAICSACGISTPSKYFKVVDYHPNNIANKLYHINFNNWKQKAFFELAFHSCNTTGGRLNSMIRFNAHVSEIKSLLCEFDIGKFLDKYPSATPAIINSFISDARKLGFIIKNPMSPPVSRWANACIKGANYIDGFSNEKDFIEDLTNIIGPSPWAPGQLKKAEEELSKRMSKPNGFGAALMCDFIKEYANYFDFIAKPDQWIVDVVNSAKRISKSYKDLTQYEIELQNVVFEVNKYYPGKGLTMYQLDRMIWLICTGDFFLDGIDLHSAFGSIYINRINGTL